MDIALCPAGSKAGYLGNRLRRTRSTRKVVMSLHSTILTTWLLGLGLLIVPPATSAQLPASDTTAQTPADSQPALADSMGASQATSDTVRPDSASAADSTRAASDTVPPKAPGSATKSDTAKAATEPPDSILSAACRGPAGSTAVARDLLVIVFAPEATAAERAAVAKTVDGSLLGSVTSEPGAHYLRVPSGGSEYQLRVASDRLILLDMVRQVGSRACPPLPPSDTTRQNPS
jgi:hypothetical protein